MTKETKQTIREELTSNLAQCNTNISFLESSCLSDIQRVYVDDNYNCVDDEGNVSTPRTILESYVTTGCVTGRGMSNARLESSFKKYLAELDHKKRLEDALANI